MKKNLYFYHGLTLVELLVGIVVGLVVLSAAGGAMISYMRSYSDSQKVLNLNQNMRAVMDIMTREIRRAGYMTSDISAMQNSPPSPRLFKSNPFFEGDYDVATYNNNQCIVFSYDKNGDAVASLGDKLGFRMGANKDIQMRKSGASGAIMCNWSGFQDLEGISDDDVVIEKLLFKIKDFNENSPPQGVNVDKSNESCSLNFEEKNCLYVRFVEIELTASIKNKPNIQQTLVQTVKIRNDKFKAKNS